MKQYLLDTNILIYAFKGQKQAGNLLKSIGKKRQLLISVINIAEISASSNTKLINRLNRLVPHYPIIEIDQKIAKLAGKLRRQSAKTNKAHLADCLIAASCISRRATLITNNPKDFKFKQLDVQKYN